MGPESLVFDLGLPADAGWPVWQARPAHPQPPGPDRGLSHVPLDAVPRLQEAARALASLGTYVQRVTQQMARTRNRQGRCFDPQDPTPPDDHDDHDEEFLARAAPALQELRRTMLAVGALADDYQRIGMWLGNEIAIGWQARDPTSAAVSGMPMGAYHRIIVKDVLAADMSLLLARLLRRVVRQLARVHFEDDPADTHDAPAGTGVPQLQAAAARLGRAADIAVDYELLLHDLDRRWQSLRDQIDQACVLPDAEDPSASPQSTLR